MQVSWKHTHAVPRVQGSTSRSLVCRPKRRLIGNVYSDMFRRSQTLSIYVVFVCICCKEFLLVFASVRTTPETTGGMGRMGDWPNII